jgi:hypothetical protein
MPLAHDRHIRLDFPLLARRATMPAMSITEAGLSLREPTGLVRVGVSWPDTEPEQAAPALVLIAPADAHELCRRLAAAAGLLVLAVETDELDVALTAVEWTADHVAQLGGDPERLSVAGVGEGAALAAEAARLCDLPHASATMSFAVAPGLSQ